MIGENGSAGTKHGMALFTHSREELRIQQITVSPASLQIVPEISRCTLTMRQDL